MTKKKFYRTLFFLAGTYNISWALLTAINPQLYFRYSGMPDINHPEIYVCLAMVIGLYGLLYIEVALRLQRGWSIVAIGLIGKVLGPVGMIYLIVSQKWPIRAASLCLFNDLIWWIPFSMYLYDYWGQYKNEFTTYRGIE